MPPRKPVRPANGPVRIDRLAETMLDPVVSRAGFSSTQILAAWPQIVGPALAECTRPEKLRWPPRRERDDGTAAPGDGATLMVRAESGEALELQYAADRIVARINAVFGWRAVARLAIRQGPVEAAPRNRAAGPETEETVESAMESGWMTRLDAVEDEELKRALARLGARIGRDDDTKL